MHPKETSSTSNLFFALKTWFEKAVVLSNDDSELDAIVLEERIYYSATPLPIPMDGAEPVEHQIDYQLDHLQQIVLEGLIVDGGGADPQSLTALLESSQTAEATSAPAENQTAPDSLVLQSTSDETSSGELVSHHVAFVDARLDNLDSLLAELRENADEVVRLDIVVLDERADGIAEIGNFLNASQHDYDSVYIFSHGASGGFQLGDVWVNSEIAELRSSDFALWQSGLTSEADLRIYGCSVAFSVAGQELLSTIAAATAADIAGSEDITGHSSLGGDWDLEYQIGTLQSNVIAESPLFADWQGTLATFTVTNTNDSGAGSLRQAILDANSTRSRKAECAGSNFNPHG